MTAAVAQSRLPVIPTQGIYEGKYRDSTPSLRSAGKLTATGDTAVSCLKPSDIRPNSPEVVRKFRASLQPGAGKTRVFYGKAYDPHLQWAKEMTHGLKVQPSFMAGDLANPPPNSLYRQRTIEKKENLYASHKKAPLGRSHDQSPGFPSDFDSERITFGIKTVKDGTAGELVNPDKDHLMVMNEAEVGRDLYRRSHFDFKVGEQNDRNYTYGSFDRAKMYGIPTPHENDGRHVRKTLKWLHDDLSEKRTPIVSQRVDLFRERTQPQLGKVHDPIKDTLNVAPDHIFGVLLKPDQYGAGDLIHNRPPTDYLRGKDRQRGVIAAMRQHLKKANYHNFPDLLAAFRHYDKNQNGKIDREELRNVCMQFSLPVDTDLIEAVMAACDPDANTGEIDYLSFINFLNWKDKMPLGLSERAVQSAPVSTPNIQPMADQPNLTSRLGKQIDSAVGGHRTSTGMINAIVGGVSSQGYRCYGVPTIRTDLPAPNVKRISDRTNYGDESNAYGLINPSMYSSKGVYEKDFLNPRPRHEIREIFANIGVDMGMDTFDRIYEMAASTHPKGEVCVETFRNVLDQVQAHQLAQQKV